MDGVTIRTIRMEDAEDFQRIFNAPGVRWGTMQTGVMTLLQARERLERMLTTPDHFALGAEMDGQLIGTIGLIGNANPRARHVAALGMSVRDEYTGRGIGTQLV